MEGETRRSTFPRAASPLAQLVDMHGGALCGRGEGGRNFGVSRNLLLPVLFWQMGCNKSSSSVDVPAECRACYNTKIRLRFFICSLLFLSSLLSTRN